MDFDLGYTLDRVERHNKAHAEPVDDCKHCGSGRMETEVKAELAAQLGRPATRAEVGAHPKMLALAAQRCYDLLLLAQMYGAPLPKDWQ